MGSCYNYQRGMLQDGATNDSAIAYANDNLFENDTNDDFTVISQVYNMWNVANVGELIDPSTGYSICKTWCHKKIQS